MNIEMLRACVWNVAVATMLLVGQLSKWRANFGKEDCGECGWMLSVWLEWLIDRPDQ
ncbi:hypothetical protein [Brucella anthropi]|uniref:hypothetical protein n=1 Tax=Brucella anthropi TaxID=529 RepID=UPI00178C7FBF|nr:hypothetical protein [Brucella anthropi]